MPEVMQDVRIKVSDSSLTQPSNEAPKEDIVARATAFKPEPQAPVSQQNDDVNFDFKQLENIKDPEAKAWAEKAYKSMQGGFTKKFNELSELRKSVESQLSQQSKWTPERIQQLLNNPEFVQAASAVAQVPNQNPSGSGLTDEEYSALTDREKAELVSLKQQVSQLQQINHQAIRSQEDTVLKSRYSNYDPNAIDTLTSDMLAGKVVATREHLYKAYYHDDNVRNAYELGKQDALKEQKEKINAISTTGLNATNLGEVPKLQPGQRREDHFRDIALAKLRELGNSIRK